ncbi:hypothetical protein R5R35_005042 [Gryllus longicercus]|uniref:Uncharacterized protein n=1 Tax=Gryllus longicercus TaxID=2509291 RepID=A0AAN9VQM5_9ORTH
MAVFIGPPEKQETACGDEEKDWPMMPIRIGTVSSRWRHSLMWWRERTLHFPCIHKTAHGGHGVCQCTLCYGYRIHLVTGIAQGRQTLRSKRDNGFSALSSAAIVSRTKHVTSCFLKSWQCRRCFFFASAGCV